MGQLVGRSLVSIDDFSNEEILSIFDLADRFRKDPSLYTGRAVGKIAASLFYEPSTRTRLSFEAAMQRLGGGVISAWDMNATSVAKGESLADTVRVVGGYSDVMVLRHPDEGAARLAAEYSPVPVINAGDGGREHPTQTLCDLYTLRDCHGTLEGIKVALCGDLKNGRTIHSLSFALARFKANVFFVPGEGKDIPDYVLSRLKRDYHAHIRKERPGVLSALFSDTPTREPSPNVDAIYMTPTQSHQLAMSPDEGTTVQFSVESGEQFSIYVTRHQTERGGESTPSGRYPSLTAKALKVDKFKNISILHPLPRVDELSPEVDSDPRSQYFKQASLGVPIRVALLWYILGLDYEASVTEKQPYRPTTRGLVFSTSGFQCPNERCITNQEKEFAHPQFELVLNVGYDLRCLYCDHDSAAAYVGNSESRIYYPIEFLDRIRPPIAPSHLRFFASDNAAESAGYRQVHHDWYRFHPEQHGQGRNWVEMVAGPNAGA